MIQNNRARLKQKQFSDSNNKSFSRVILYMENYIKQKLASTARISSNDRGMMSQFENRHNLLEILTLRQQCLL